VCSICASSLLPLPGFLPRAAWPDCEEMSSGPTNWGVVLWQLGLVGGSPPGRTVGLCMSLWALSPALLGLQPGAEAQSSCGAGLGCKLGTGQLLLLAPAGSSGLAGRHVIWISSWWGWGDGLDPRHPSGPRPPSAHGVLLLCASHSALPTLSLPVGTTPPSLSILEQHPWCMPGHGHGVSQACTEAPVPLTSTHGLFCCRHWLGSEASAGKRPSLETLSRECSSSPWLSWDPNLTTEPLLTTESAGAHAGLG
jgi:hypothetical protein